MDGHKPAARTTGSLFVDRLDAASRACLLAHGEMIQMLRDQSVYELDAPMESVFFPIDGAISIVTAWPTARRFEVGFIGREGMTGLPVVLGGGWVPQRAYVQIAARALCVPEAGFRECLRSTPDLQTHSLRYAQAAMTSVA